MKFYDIELVDKDPNTDNFKFSKVNDQDLANIKQSFITEKKFLEFTSKEGNSFLETSFFRGVMYHDHIEQAKSVQREMAENSVEISKIPKNKKDR
jgi:hypothetical protein